MCTFSMEGRDFERKKYSVRTGKINKKKHILLFILGQIFKEFIYLHNLGNYLKKINGPEIFTGGNLFNIIIGELMFVYFFGGGWGTVL